MKKIFCVLFAMTIGVIVYSEEVMNLWSGQDIVLPQHGKWQIIAPHGRILTSGNGRVTFQIPALVAEATLDATLIINGKSQDVKFYSPKVLVGKSAFLSDEYFFKKLTQYGIKNQDCNIFFARALPKNINDGKTFVFPDKLDFPLPLGDKWQEISMFRAKILGTLSVLIDKKEQFADINGDFSYIMLKKDNKELIIFSPNFNFDNIDNIILLKKLIERESK